MLAITQTAQAAPRGIILPAAVGGAVCLQPHVNVPGLVGTPNWFDASGQIRRDFDDPRWGGAPLTSFYLTNKTDNLGYRFMRSPDGKVMYVQIAVRADAKDPSETDEIYFGVSSTDGATGAVVKFSPTGSGALPLAPDSAVTSFWNRVGGAWGAVQSGLPGWVDNSGIWNDPNGRNNSANADRNYGVFWGINFSVNLQELGLDLSANDLKFMLLARIDQPRGVALYGFPNVGGGQSSCPRNCTATAGVCPATTAAPENAPCDCVGVCNTAADGPFYPDPRGWPTLSRLATECKGISLQDYTQIEATSTLPASATVTQDGSYVNTSAELSNSWSITPHFTGSATAGTPPAADNVYSARFRIANWGSIADANGEWRLLPTRPNPLPTPPAEALTLQSNPLPNVGGAGALTYSCNNAGNAGAGRNICGQVDPTHITSQLHQCLLVELQSTDPTNRENLVLNAAAYRNMYYADLSRHDAIAELSVKGLQTILGNNADRDIYLHVKRSNLPFANSDKRKDDIPALLALREQTDRAFANSSSGCNRPTDQCQFVEGTGVCMSPCTGAEGRTCAPNDNQLLLPNNGGCYCYTVAGESFDSCTYRAAPKGGGYDPTKSSLTPGTVLRANYPTLEVFPYYDTGRTTVVRGVTKPVLAPMPSFGIHFKHEATTGNDGSFYGYLWGITKDDGSLLEQITPDYYRVRVPNEGKVRLKVSVETADVPHYAPFTQIVGTATPLPFGIGNATFSGLSGSTTGMDLSKTTVTIEKLLREGNTELVTNFTTPVVLTRNSGATPNLATFSRAGSPTVTMQVANLPIIGQTVTFQVINASINYPSTCPLTFGTANLATSFIMSDGVNKVAVGGTDQWSCVPGQLLNIL